MSSSFRSLTLILGSGRSGTTWLMNLLNHDTRHEVRFEPLHHAFLPREHFDRSRGGIPSPALRERIERAFEGPIASSWIRRFVPPEGVECAGVVVKTIRLHGFLRWLLESYPEMRLILLLRHPLAVALSQRRMAFGDVLARRLRGDEPDRAFPGARPMLEAAESPIARGAADWCIANLLALRDLDPERAHVLFYEHLVRRPEVELQRLERFLRRPFGGSARALLTKPSELTSQDSPLHRGEDPSLAWRVAMPPSGFDSGVDMLERLGMDWLYDRRLMPLVDPDALLQRRPAELGERALAALVGGGRWPVTAGSQSSPGASR